MKKSTKKSELILFDSNILVFAHNVASPFQKQAEKLISSVIDGRLSVVLAQQNLLEFYSIITNPKRVQMPIGLTDVHFLINEYLRSGIFNLIYPKETTLTGTFGLAEKHKIKGADIFDAYLATTMLDNDVGTIYTDNIKHFEMFDKIKAVNPFK